MDEENDAQKGLSNISKNTKIVENNNNRARMQFGNEY